MTQVEYKGRNKPKIKFLTDSFGNDEGDVVNVQMETDEEIYYYDSFKRWCYLLKTEEGTNFVWKKKSDFVSDNGER